MDDWATEFKPADKVNVPSFIRLFIIARVLKSVNTNNDTIKKLASEMGDSKTRQIVENILTKLTTNGIKKYMKYHFKAEEQIQTIEKIFNDIILKKYEKEYVKIITYTHDSGSEYYQSAVFNTDDLMCYIFEFIELESHFTGDLINCGLVNSHWLYQSWNTNLIYPFGLDKLISDTIHLWLRSDIKNDVASAHIGKWQRIANVKSIECYSYAFSNCTQGYNNNDNNSNNNNNNSKHLMKFLLRQLSMLKSVTHVEFEVDENCLSFLKILDVYRKKIEWYHVKITKHEIDLEGCIFKENMLSLLKLSNAQVIFIFHMYYHLMWTNKCHTLIINGLKEIESGWCQYIIDNCDCSGIKKLVFDGITFCTQMNNLENSTKLLLTKLGQKFENLEHIVIRQCGFDHDYLNPCVLQLIQSLSKVVKKNKARVALKIMTDRNCDKLVQIFSAAGIMVNSLNTWMRPTTAAIDSVKPLILNNRDLECLDICESTGMDDLGKWKQIRLVEILVPWLATHENFKSSLQMISVHRDDVNDKPKECINAINQLLSLKTVEQNKVFVRLHVAIDIDKEKHDDHFKVSFERLCKILFLVLTIKQIPIEFILSINSVTTSYYDNTLNPIFNINNKTNPDSVHIVN